jgi:hypothetical protein
VAQVREARTGDHVPADLIAPHLHAPRIAGEVPALLVDQVEEQRVVVRPLPDRVEDRNLRVADHAATRVTERHHRVPIHPEPGPAREAAAVDIGGHAREAHAADPVAFGKPGRDELLAEAIRVAHRLLGQRQALPVVIEIQRAQRRHAKPADLVGRGHAQAVRVDVDLQLRRFDRRTVLAHVCRPGIIALRDHRAGPDRRFDVGPRADGRELEMRKVVAQDLDDQVPTRGVELESLDVGAVGVALGSAGLDAV